jgi:hypothetical protein
MALGRYRQAKLNLGETEAGLGRRLGVGDLGQGVDLLQTLSPLVFHLVEV